MEDFNGNRIDFHSTPPNSVELERCVIGAAFCGAETAEHVVLRCAPADFYDTRLRRIHGVMREMYNAAFPIVPTAVADRLVSLLDKQEDRIVYVDLVETCMNEIGVCSPDLLDYYAARLKEYADKRELRAVGLHAFLAAYQAEPARPFFDSIAQDLLRKAMGHDQSRLRHIKEVHQDLTDQMSHAEEMRGSQILTGFSDFDRTFGPVYPGWLIYIAGRPSSGKTAMALKMALNIAAGGTPVLFATLEMSDTEADSRVIAPGANVPSRTIRECPGDMGESVARQIKQAMAMTCALPLWFASKKASIIDLRRDIQQVAARCRKHPVLFVDRFELIDEMKAWRDNRNQQAEHTSAMLADLAKTQEIPVFCLVQLNRECEKRADKRPMLADLRNSGGMEQDAMRVIGIYRDAVYSKGADKGVGELIVLKNMHGRIGTVKVCFREDFPTFDNLEARQDADDHEEWWQR